jgi:hypothetical protein
VTQVDLFDEAFQSILLAQNSPAKGLAFQPALSCLTTPAGHGCVAPQSAGIGATGRNFLKGARRRGALLILIAAPADDGSVGLEAAGVSAGPTPLLKTTATRGDLLEDASRRGGLTIIVGPPTQEDPVRLYAARVVASGGQLLESTAGGAACP